MLLLGCPVYGSGLCCHQGPCRGQRSCCSQDPCWCLWPVMWQKAMLMSIVYIMPRSVANAGIGVHVNIHGFCCQQKSCGRPWSVLLLIVKNKEATFEVEPMIANLWLRKGIIEGFFDNPYTLTHPFPHKRNTINNKTPKRAIKNLA